MKSHSIKEHLENANISIGLGIILNVAFVIVEVVFGIFSDSLALLADAGHNAGDVLGLLLAFGANLLLRRKPDPEHTYGWRGATIIAALLNAVILLGAVGGISYQAISRLGEEIEVASFTVIWVAGIGTIINMLTALLFVRNQEKDLNIRGAFLHMAADAGVSAGVVFSGIVIRLTGYYWLDPVVSLVIAAVILWSTWGLMRDAIHLAISGVPRKINIKQVLEKITAFDSVQGVHDLHVWGLSTTEMALTAHVEVLPRAEEDLLTEIVRELKKSFEIDHITLQFEQQKLDTCHEEY
jgi:cobalt-zinc-cadmium efflux system protein